MKQNNVIFCVLLFTFIFGTAVLQAQNDEVRFKVHGKIIDSRTKKALKYVSFKVMPFNRTVNADSKGAFVLNMPVGSYSLLFDHSPYDKQEFKFKVAADTNLVVALHSPYATTVIEEVEVIESLTANERVSNLNTVSNRMLKVLPTMNGERDVLKSFAMTSGVSSSSEGSADLQVRGGVHGQNLFLLDDIPMYSTQHFFGLVSAYNPSIVKSATLYKSNFPAEFGGKISSVVNVATEDASVKKRQGEAEIGLITSKIGVNVLLIKDTLAISLAGRVSNYSILNLVSFFLPKNLGVKYGLFFGDINSNISWKLSAKDKLKLTYFINSDVIDIYSPDYEMATNFWLKNSQQSLGLNWYRNFTSDLKNHSMVFLDQYIFQNGSESKSTTLDLNSRVEKTTSISSFGFNDKLIYEKTPSCKYTLGFTTKHYLFNPLTISTELLPYKKESVEQLNENVFFAETEYKLMVKHKFTTGLRFSAMGNAQKYYAFAEPRFGYQFDVAKDLLISASAGRMTQPIHRVANAGLGLPFEMFIPSGTDIKPSTSWNYSTGFVKDWAWNKSAFIFKTDVWYKTFENIVEFKDGYDAMYTQLIFQNSTAPSKIVTQGNGFSYGLDASAVLKRSNFKLSADYTYMKARNLFAELNNGKYFDAPTDMRHTLSLLGEVVLSDEWTLVATWQYHTGKPITVPTYVYPKPTNSGESQWTSGIKYIETERNNYRMRDFHKLDISFVKKYRAFKRYEGTFTAGLYNVYNQNNPYLYFVESVQNKDNSYTPTLKSLSVFPIMPSFNWLVKF